MSFPSIAAALTEDDGNGSDFSDADHHDEGLPMEVSLRLQAKGSLAALLLVLLHRLCDDQVWQRHHAP